MDNLEKIFNQSISEVDDEEKKSRDECKKILQNRGIVEILEYIISVANKPVSDQSDNEKKIINELITIAENDFYKRNHANLGQSKSSSLSKSEYKKWYVYQINISFEYTSSGNYFWRNPSVDVLITSVNLSTKEVSVRRPDKKELLHSEPEDSKEIIAQKIIRFILTGII